MRKVIGIALVLIGIAPSIGVLWMWSQHMYTVGLSMDARGAAILTLLVCADLCCLVAGFYLLRSQKISS